MAKASIKIICATCGKDFVHSAFRSNRADADQYEAWARDHITICPACYRKAGAQNKSARVIAALSDANITLPTLNAASDKQRSYAESVRLRALQAESHNVDLYIEVMASWEADGAKSAEATKDHLASIDLANIHALLTIDSARDLLDQFAR